MSCSKILAPDEKFQNHQIKRETKSLLKRPLLAIAGTTTSDRPVISPSTLPTCRATVYHLLVDTTKHPPRGSSLLPLPFALSIKPPLPRRGGRWSQDLARVLPAWGTRRRSGRSTSSGRCHPDGTSRPEGIVSGWATHLDGDAGHDLQRERHLERLVVVALIDEAQRFRVRQAESANAPRAQRRRPILHVCRRLLSPPSPPPPLPPR